MVLLRFAGKECTQEYDQHHSELVMVKYHEKLCIGTSSNKKYICPTTLNPTQAASMCHPREKSFASFCGLAFMCVIQGGTTEG